jgi:hypothetical protein
LKAHDTSWVGPDLESYTFEQRIVLALYLVATKCGQLLLRKEAIELLKSSHRREGLWDSFLSAKVAEWMMGLQDGQRAEIGNVEGHRLERNDRRVFGETIELDVQGRKATVRCRQIAEDGGSVKRSTVISW